MIFVFVNKRSWKSSGPIINMVTHNAASLSSLGYETHLCLGAGEPSNTDDDLSQFYGLEDRDNFKIHRVPPYHFLGSSLRFSVFVRAFKLIKILAKKERVVVITRDSDFLPLLAYLCRTPQINGYFELHDFYADLSWVVKKSSQHYREKINEHLFLPRMNGLICITEAQQERYHHVFTAIPSCTFPLGTKPRVNTASIETVRMRRKLMYVGHMHGEKGVDFLMQVAAKLAEIDVKISFWGGKANAISVFEKKAQALGIADMVEFVPFQPPEVLQSAIAEQASLGIVMLRDTYYNRYLTCPVKALDYLSHGIPAIGSDIPSVHEVLRDAGTYIQPDDVDGFVAAVQKLLDDAAHYAEMTTRARERARQITWAKRAQTIAAFAESTLTPDPSS
jgi:glycosyltransferase involved in cell wall biosynthesis